MLFEKRYPIQSLFLSFMIVLLFSACVTELDLIVKEQSTRLVVYGNFTQGAGDRFVSIRRTGDFGSQVGEIVKEAQVFLVDEKGISMPFLETQKGDYRFENNRFQAIAGQKYYLDIELKSGERYRSEASIMPAPLAIKRSYYTFSPINPAQQRPAIDIRVDLDAAPNPRGTYLRWDLRRTWQRTSVDLATHYQSYYCFDPPVRCYMTDSLTTQVLPLFGTPRSGGFSLVEQKLYNLELDYKFWEKNCIQVIQYHSTPEAFIYWEKVSKVANQQGTIFDPPPAAVSGNMYLANDPDKRILGFFELSAADTAYIFVEQEELKQYGYYTPNPCSRDPSNKDESWRLPCIKDPSYRFWQITYEWPPACAFCQKIAGHSTVRPSFWR